MFYVYMSQNCYLAFLGQGLAFLVQRLATLLCSFKGAARIFLRGAEVMEAKSLENENCL